MHNGLQDQLVLVVRVVNSNINIYFIFFTLTEMFVGSRVFQKFDEVCNNGNIGIRGFTTWKKISDKMVSPVGIEPGPLIACDSKSNTILSTLCCLGEL